MYMTQVQVEEFLAHPHIATLVTLREDGSPGAAPLWFEWDGTKVLLFSPWRTAKVQRLMAEPRCAVSITAPSGQAPAWVTVEGLASVSAGGIQLARRLVSRYYPPEVGDAAMARWESDPDSLALVTVSPTRVTHW
jgi:PPOX class probable F420-dependent enzyme